MQLSLREKMMCPKMSKTCTDPRSLLTAIWNPSKITFRKLNPYCQPIFPEASKSSNRNQHGSGFCRAGPFCSTSMMNQQHSNPEVVPMEVVSRAATTLQSTPDHEPTIDSVHFTGGSWACCGAWRRSWAPWAKRPP